MPRVLLILGLALGTLAAPGLAAAQPAILLWPAEPAAAESARAVRDSLADRGGLSPVDEGPLRARVAEGPRVDPLLFVSEAGRVAESAEAAIAGSARDAVEMTRAPEREYLADLATPTGVRGLRTLALARARALAAAGERTAASREALFAVSLDVAGEIDPATLRADLRPLVDAATRELARLPRVAVAVDSAPQGAQVTVDGRAAGRTPVEIEAPPGAHVVRVDRPGFEAAARIVEVGMDGGALDPFPLRAALGEPLLEQISVLAAAGELAPDDPEALGLLGAAAQARYVGVVRRTDAGVAVTVFEPGSRRLVGVGSGRTGEAAAREVERLTLGAPVRPRGGPPPPPPPPPRTHFWEKWWFWTAAGVVAAAGVGTVVILSQPDPDGVARWRD